MGQINHYILLSTKKREKDILKCYKPTRIKNTGKEKTATNSFESGMMIDACDWYSISKRVES